jgi:hypothetical protein
LVEETGENHRQFESRSWRVVLETHFYDKVFSDLPHAGGFLWVLHHENDISEISLKVASNTITPILILSEALELRPPLMGIETYILSGNQSCTIIAGGVPRENHRRVASH